MSAFTPFNGPQCNSGPSTRDITQLIEAYNQLSVKLNAHIEATAPTDSAVHGIVNYVNSIRTQLEAIIAVKAPTTALNEVRTIAENAATQSALSQAVNTLNSLIADKADANALAAKTDKVTTEAMQRAIETIAALLDDLRVEWENLDSHLLINDTTIAVDCAIKSAAYIIGQLKVYKSIDFTKWAHFAAPFAGTGSLEDTSNNGAFILGCMSLDWSDDPNAPAEAYAHKAARAYIKYVNSNPFDAICDMTATKTDEGYVGSLTVHVTKKADTWPDLAFHLIVGTNSTHEECVYLAVSSRGLASSSGDYSNTNFRACGENFLPVGVEGYITPTGMLHGVTSAPVGTGVSSIVSIDNVRLSSMNSDAYRDSQGYNLLSVVHSTDPDTGLPYNELFVGDPHYDAYIFRKRPAMVLQDEHGQNVLGYFVTAQDIVNATLPIGAIIGWPLQNPDHSLRDIPEGFLDITNGGTINNTDYPVLAEMLGVDAHGEAQLPVQTNSIIKAYDTTTSYSEGDASVTDIIEFSTLNKKINTEINRATTAENGLSARIDTNAENIAANTSAIEAEVQRATVAEQTNATNITQTTTAINQNTSAITQNTADIAANAVNIASNSDRITTETFNRTTADQALNARIDALQP